jgi:hypothetical protein
MITVLCKNESNKSEGCPKDLQVISPSSRMVKLYIKEMLHKSYGMSLWFAPTSEKDSHTVGVGHM